MTAPNPDPLRAPGTDDDPDPLLGSGLSVIPDPDEWADDDEDRGLWAGVAVLLTVAVVAFVAGWLARG